MCSYGSTKSILLKFLFYQHLKQFNDFGFNFCLRFVLNVYKDRFFVIAIQLGVRAADKDCFGFTTRGTSTLFTNFHQETKE